MLAHGLVAKLEANYLGSLQDFSCGDQIIGNAISLSFSDIWASFLILPAGLAVALVILVWERSDIHGKFVSKQIDIHKNSSNVNSSNSSAYRWDSGTHHAQVIRIAAYPIHMHLHELPKHDETIVSADESDSEGSATIANILPPNNLN